MTVLIDTGVLYAFLNLDDARASDADRFFRTLRSGKLGAPAVTDLVVAELFNLLRARGAPASVEGKARELLLGAPPGLPGLRILPTGREGLDEAWTVYARHRSRRISFTDATLLVMLERLGLDGLATFDRTLDSIAARPAFD